MSNSLPPELMTVEERLDEIAELLAAGILRAHRRQKENPSRHLEKVRVDFSPRRRGHVVPSGQRRRKA